MEIDRDQIEVSNDNDFLQLLMDKHNINAKQLACWTGRRDITIYKYLEGQLTIPSIIWRAIYERTGDISVFNIIKGDLPILIAPLNPVMLEPSADILNKIIEKRQKQIDCEKYVLQILQDGRKDYSDDIVMINYKQAFAEAISAEATIYQTILHKVAKIAGVR